MASWFHPSAEYGIKKVCAMNLVTPPAYVEVVNEANGRVTHCDVIGTGPFVPGRVIDLSPAAAQELGSYYSGIAPVRVYRVSKRQVNPIDTYVKF